MTTGHALHLSSVCDAYIRAGWDFLRRSALDPAPDPKVEGGRVAYLYVSQTEDLETVRAKVRARAAARGFDASETMHFVRRLPADGVQDSAHGLLYLPNDYIVPGGRFNEMYGWDSYWILQGLVDARLEALAAGMVENFFYEIDHYGGKILNANRTYYLFRSQPPFLSLMISEVAASKNEVARMAFLARAAGYLARDCAFWERSRWVPETGLFRYGDPEMGRRGPCPEVVMGEVDPKTGQNHYDKILAFLRDRPENDALRLRFYDAQANKLTPAAVASDRALRESGFDPSMAMGYFGLETLDLNPVCLNSLMVIQYRKLAEIHALLGSPQERAFWADKAQRLAARIQALLWDDANGLFASYNHRTKRQTAFPFLTTVYPLFAGVATQDQAQRVRDAVCTHFEKEHGLAMSPLETGCQWDGPYMWAPLVDLTLRGLIRYGFKRDAARLGQRFLDTVQNVFAEYNGLFEKYNARTGKHTTENVLVGYADNVVGFGWTNAVVGRVQALLTTLKKEDEGSALPTIL